jgi:DNA-binding response OmpR family regulator
LAITNLNYRNTYTNERRATVNAIPDETEARGFALYVGIDENTAKAAGVTLTELVNALRATLNEKVPGLATETYAAVALAPKYSGGRNVDVVRSALRDPRALDQHAGKTEDENHDGVVVDLSRRKVLVNGENAELTQKEFELLNYLIENTGETVSRRELVELVWNSEDDTAPNDRTIDVHIRRLRAKIAGFEDIIRTIRGGGYRFDSHPDVQVADYQI